MNILKITAASGALRKKLFALSGVLLLLASVWMFPIAPQPDSSDTTWNRYLLGSEWVFSRHDGTVITDSLTFSLFGKILGYKRPNERAWRVQRRTLELIGTDGKVTSRFQLGAAANSTDGLQLIQPPENGPHELHEKKAKKLSRFALLLVTGLTMLIVSVWRIPAFAKSVTQKIREREWKNGRSFAYIALAIWFFTVCTLASTPAYVPDEAWFLIEALTSSRDALINHDWLVQLAFHHNAFGYGGIWWSIYTGITLLLHGLLDFLLSPQALSMIADNGNSVKVQLWEHATPALVAPMVLMRFLVLFSLAAFGSLIVRYARSASAALLSVAILITLPIAWWSGKLASPELLSAALFAMGVYSWFILRNEVPALLLASLAVAMKLTVMPVYLVMLIFMFWDLRKVLNRSSRQLALYALLCLAVFLFGNLWLVYAPQQGIEQLLYLSRAYHPNPDWHMQSNLLLFLHAQMWEGTNYGSLSYWSGGLILIATSLIVAMITDRRLGLFLLTGGCAQYLFMMTQPYHGWYWFPVVLATVVPFSQLRSGGVIIVAIILFVGLWPFKFTQRELSYKSQHLRELQEVADQKACIAKKLSEYEPEIVFDMASIGTLPAKSPSSTWIVKNYHDSFVAVVNGFPETTPSQKRILVLGEKTRSVHNFPPPRSNKPYEMLGTCGSIQLIKV